MLLTLSEVECVMLFGEMIVKSKMHGKQFNIQQFYVFSRYINP